MSSSHAHTAAVFAAGAAVGAAALYLYTRSQWVSSSSAAPDTGLHRDGGVWHPHHAPHHSSHASVQDFHDDEILSEQLVRNVQFFGLEAQRRIAGSFVVVVGLGVSPTRTLGHRPASCSLLSLPCPAPLSAALCFNPANPLRPCPVLPWHRPTVLPKRTCRAWAAMLRTCCCGRAWGGCG